MDALLLGIRFNVESNGQRRFSVTFIAEKTHSNFVW